MERINTQLRLTKLMRECVNTNTTDSQNFTLY